jgi:SAM-dependent methyltransferase
MTEYLKGQLIRELVAHFGEDTRRIEHAIDVLTHALALLENMPEADAEVVAAAAVTHDFGIKRAEEIHGSNNGKLQEEYGPDAARPALERCGLETDKVEAVVDIIAHHHSRVENPSVEFLILTEADWLVNVYDSPGVLDDAEKTRLFIERNFTTDAGKKRARRLLPDGEELFQEMGKVYKVLVSTGSRREKEQDFLLNAIADHPMSGSEDFLVVDLACGTGFHSRILAEKGYQVLALDYTESLLNEAGEQTSSDLSVEYRMADLREPLPSGTRGDYLLLLGNTLSVFDSPDLVEEVLKNVFDAASDGARLLCQIVNYEPLLDEGEAKHLTRRGEVDGQDTVLTKTLMPLVDRGRVLIQLAASRRDADGHWSSFARPSLLQPLAPKALTSAARNAGWSERGRWGDLQGNAYDEKESSDFVLLLEK